MNASVREVKNRLSEYLRKVRAGERVVITDRGRPVAELQRVSARRGSSKARLERLETLGEVTRPLRRLADVEPVRVKGRPVSETLLEDRD